MSLELTFRRLVYAQVLLGIVAFCIAGRNPVLLLVGGTAAAMAWYLTEGPGGRPMPRWLTTVTALVAVAWLVVEVFVVRTYVVAAVGQFVLWLQVILLYAQKTNRDYAQLLILSVMLVIGASVLSVSMIVGAMVILYSVTALLTAVVYQIKTSRDEVHEGMRRGAERPGRVSPPAAVASAGFVREFVASSLLIGLLILIVGGGVFVALPREADRPGEAGLNTSAASAATGFSDHVDLSHPPGPATTKEPVMHVSVSVGGVSVRDELRGWLVRGAVLDEYRPNGRQWRRSVEVAALDRMASTRGDRTAWLRSGREWAQRGEAEITIRRPMGRVLFSLHPVVSVSDVGTEGVEYNPLDQTLRSVSDLGGVTVYRVSWSSIRSGPGLDVDASPASYSAALDLSAEDLQMYRDAMAVALDWRVQADRIGRLSREVLGRAGVEEPLAVDPQAEVSAMFSGWEAAAAGPPGDRPRGPGALGVTAAAERSWSAWSDHPEALGRWRAVQALADHLRRAYSYTEQAPIAPPGSDPVVEFLFAHRTGHCELFASALAAMSRTLGIPSRVVTGYRASEFNAMGGYYVIRDAYAHAWTEVYLGPELGWRTVDPTPPDRVLALHSRGRDWFSSIRDVYEHLEYRWLRSVVTYDHRTRAEVISNMRSATAVTFSDPTGFPGNVIAWARSIPSATHWQAFGLGFTVFIGVTLLLAIGVLARLLVIHRRRIRMLQLHTLPGGRRRELLRHLGFYIEMLDLLERKGYRRPVWQSPFAFAQELAEANPMKFDPVLSLTEAFYEVRFGHRRPDIARRRAIRAHLRRLREALGPTGEV